MSKGFQPWAAEQDGARPSTVPGEPGTGFEPVCAVLQTAASPLGQPGVVDLQHP